MRILSRYINDQFFSSTIAFFVPLFGIASLIFFIKLVSITALLQLSFFELIKLYIFTFPQILFFTLPVVFFAASIAMMHRLSFEYEMVALFSLAISPYQIIKHLGKLAAILSLFMLIFSLILMPQAKQLFKGFIVYKRAQAKLNIKPSEFGHKFGDWYLFIGNKEKEIYHNVTLYNHNFEGRENFILAQNARLFNEKDGLALLLHNGNAYSYEKNELKEIHFEKMKIYDTGTGKIFHYTNPLDYWLISLKSKKRAFDFTLFVLFSLFPLFSLFYAGILGIGNPRFERKGVFIATLGIMALFFGIAFALAKAFTFYALLFLPLWLGIGALLFHKLVAKRY
ncbi:lipopolysaccharide export system permease protein [Nitratiruptor sp. YY08-26]|uniref:LptF/LptG family permease n=1 Tax=unclassified Nitratiruptor TaxID=2624044 RepID=UPI0019158472|nr:MULTISPECIES: LptF/LptG family permease [unclassified Nitratiruptor]BCD62013.1 lipopolysaccharide export system permease protein [Nitratiruptor sp. YY08-13]BCD65949.1 lipopolysaccharide export system permease protein [Nitratiruptor sp. YY08-26]